MIDREQLARVLDPDAWNLPESAGTALYRRHALERADRLLSDPRYAVVELPDAEMPVGSDGSVTFSMPVAWAGEMFGGGPSRTKAMVTVCRDRIPQAEALAAAILAAARKAEQHTQEKQ